LDIIVKVEASELVSAIRQLAAAYCGTLVPAQLSETPAQPPAIVQQPAPAQPQPAPAVPVQTPAQTPVQQPAQPPVQAVPTSAPTYTMEQLAVAATPLIDGGRRQELVNLLAAFGVRALTELPKERYGEFATALRQLGAKI